ncbi:transcription initiation factor TFIID subunit 1 [Impatiens glandulifera]|uniref:transcription initiation factor TFIID subunit 1 n=1 Tax=Impatiens glandulifera TaxID=253017 RepID=UPI001FB0B58E|nr:transcription initiation factor TFIID subunit 1 [Impatiens glandulifera]
MGDDSDSTSQDGRDEDDEDEYEEAGKGKLLGFMFGNVDDSGDLDVDYLDEDAKEHLSALADKLGPTLTDIDLSAKSQRTPADTAEEDYGEKAEDAVDYEDIDEQYEGPEVQAASEEDYLLPKKDFYSTEVPLSDLKQTTSVFDDENYDEDEDDIEREHELVDIVAKNDNIHSGPLGDSMEVVSEGEQHPIDDNSFSSPEMEHISADSADDIEEELEDIKEQPDERKSTSLPVLCIEDGSAILRFSEIFGNFEPLKKSERRDNKYIFLKERYISMDASDIVEEDEESFLRSRCQVSSVPRQVHAIQDSMSMGAESDATNLDMTQVASSLGPQVRRSKESHLSAEPMKEDVVADPFSEWSSSLSGELYLLDLQDWENNIVWDNSPAMSGNAAESCESPDPDSEAIFNAETEGEIGQPNFQAESQEDSNEKDFRFSLSSCHISVEPFGANEISGARDQILEQKFHPQHLRLESTSIMDVADSVDFGKDGTSEETKKSDIINHLSRLSLQNRELIAESWLDRIVWDPHQSIPKPKLIFDLQDEQMLYEILDIKDGKQLQLHAGAMFITQSSKSGTGDSVEPYGHNVVSVAQFNIANDKYYSNRKVSQQLKSHSKKRTAHGVKVLHSIPALKLQTMKPKLSNKDIANFHRPRSLWYPHDNEVVVKEQAKLSTQGPMKIILKSLGGKGSKLHVNAEETVSSVKAKASKKLDFKPMESVKIYYSGRELEDHESLSAQNVRPNSLLHLVRTKIHLMPRAQKLPGENKALRPPGAFKKKSDLSVKDGHVFLMEYCEERPLLLGNAGMGARLCTYYQKTSPGDQTGNLLRNGSNTLGTIITLDPADKSPFLGDIKAGCSQSCLETNMYRAPIFSHKVSTTDYLLVRSAKGKLSIRRIDGLHVVGQQEPHIEVMSPASKGVQAYIINRLLVFIYREFWAVGKRGLLPCIRADELSAHFPSLSEAFLRKRLKHCADLQRRSNGQLFWVMRRNFSLLLEEALRRMVTPENVCAYESMLAGQYRLKRLGITRLIQPTGLSSAMSQLPDEAIALAAASHIERELQITPWNLSSNFVVCTSQDRDNIERLEITGVGDPSGRGLGFSYVRTVPKAPISNAPSKKKVAITRGGSTVTGTDADLRRLSMEAAREVLLKFNVPEEQIAKLTRWHRIAMIRKLSSEQASTGVKVDATTINKYARGQRMSFVQLQQQTREKCQEIWDRQVQSLAAIDGDEFESDTEAHSDLDSFAGDLENLLDAEEFEVEDGNFDSKHDKVDGVRGIKMRRRQSQAQAEEENEDEAAEAAELCRMLMDDDVSERKKKKKTRVVADDNGVTPGMEFSLDIENAEHPKKTNTMMKKSATTAKSVEFSLKDDTVQEPKKEENIHIKKGQSSKIKSMRKDDMDMERIGLFTKKVKILGDGIKGIKEKKSARESFVCGACGQLGHMRTNKHCPKYREDTEAYVEIMDQEKTPIPPDRLNQSHPKTVKKLISKGATKIAVIEAPEDDNRSTSKTKTLKVKCGSSTDNKISDKFLPPTPSVNSREYSEPMTNKPVVKVNKITFSKKTEHEFSSQVESHRQPSVVIKPPGPSSSDREQSRKKIIIRQPKEVINADQVSQEGSSGFEYRKIKKIVELPQNEQQERKSSIEVSALRKMREDERWWEEKEREREERNRRLCEQKRIYEEQEKLDELRRYQEDIRREREEEELEKAKRKKKKKKPEVRDDYLLDDDLPPRMINNNDRLLTLPERDHRASKRRSVVELGRYGADYAPPAKRRRGGEVGLSNILETIVDTLRARTDISYLFLKPVTKKEAPDYLKIIERPMNLSTIREKIKNLGYKNRQDFRHDVWQITYNAHKYNDGRNPCIPPLADQLLELCDFLLDQNDAALAEAEASIDFMD